MADEVELKLELTAEGADALEASGLFSSPPEIIVQNAIYFDTPDFALSDAGLSLRIRRNGDVRVQTVKAGGTAAAGVFVRSEWEREVEGDSPIFDATTPVAALLGDKVSAVVPLFTVQNERRLWTRDGIEIALDRGHVIAGEREAPVCEVELEQKGGDHAALFALARRMDAAAPVHLGVLSKAERGYRLLGPAPRAAKAGPIGLTPAMDAAGAFREIARSCLRHFRLNVPLVLDRQDSSALHQARVALRRFRSALSIYKPMLGESVGTLNGEARWLAGELSRARSLDVLADRASGRRLRERLLEAKDAAYANAIAALQSDRGRGLMIDAAQWIAIGDWAASDRDRALRELPARDFAASALDRLRRKVKKGGRDLEELDDETRHEVRKAAKKLRYAAEFFAPLYGHKRERRRYERFVAALETLQDHLGTLNDLATAPEILNALGLADDPDAGKLIGADGKADLLEAAAEAHDAFVDMKRFWR